VPSPESDPATTPSPAPHVGTGACDFCGGQPDPDRALEVGVRHTGGDGDAPRTVGLRFCDGGHASAYFAQGRLAEVRVAETQTAPPVVPRRGVDLVLVAMVAAFLVSLTLILIGCWQVAQWVLA
jgi:hypothetical protein